MTKLVADLELQAKLNACNQQVEVCDEVGRTLGYFVTVEQYHYWMLEWAKLKFPQEELDRVAAEPGGRTTAEVLERLQQL